LKKKNTLTACAVLYNPHNKEQEMKNHMILLAVLVLSNVVLGGFLSPPSVSAGGHYYDGYRHDQGYYPRYRQYNPVVRRDYYSSERYRPDGTYHEEDKVVDRHSSYYSPGRNEAITRPRTTVESWGSSPSQRTTQEKTSWVGADGRPHSTTITRDTTVDPWGNSHTDTHVALRKVKPAN